VLSPAPPSKKIDGIYTSDASLCKECRLRILPIDIRNLRTVRNCNIVIHAATDCVIEVRCNACGARNYRRHPASLTDTELDEIVKLTN
jgi:hypothetical protein